MSKNSQRSARHNPTNRWYAILILRADFFQWSIWKNLLDDGDFEGCDSSPDEGVKAHWWNPKWIPFTYSGSGDHHCIDLDPAPSGFVGQVILMWHDRGGRELKAKSLTDFFERYVSDVLAGRYVYTDEFGGIVDTAFYE